MAGKLENFSAFFVNSRTEEQGMMIEEVDGR